MREAPAATVDSSGNWWWQSETNRVHTPLTQDHYPITGYLSLASWWLMGEIAVPVSLHYHNENIVFVITRLVDDFIGFVKSEQLLFLRWVYLLYAWVGTSGPGGHTKYFVQSNLLVLKMVITFLPAFLKHSEGLWCLKDAIWIHLYSPLRENYLFASLCNKNVTYIANQLSIPLFSPQT